MQDRATFDSGSLFTEKHILVPPYRASVEAVEGVVEAAHTVPFR